MNVHVEVIPGQSPHKVKVSVDIGTTTVAKNLPKSMAKAFIRNTIVSALRRYINHRDQILSNHGGVLTESKARSLKKLKYAIEGSSKWSLEKLPRIILNWSEHLINVAPGTRSKYYQHNSQLLIDLIQWAKDELSGNKNFFC